MTGRTILLIHSGGLGDVLLALPAFRAIRASYPESRIGLLAAQPIADLLTTCGEIDRTFPLDGTALTELLAGPEHVTPGLRSWLIHCELVMAWIQDPDGALAASCQTLGAKRIRIQPASGDMPARLKSGGPHQTERLLQGLPVQRVDDPLPLSLPGTLRAEGRHTLERFGLLSVDVVGVHPGSGSRHKCSTANTMVQVIAALRTQGMTPLLLEGPADRSIAREVLNLCGDPPPVASDMPLKAMAGLMAHLDIVIGHDSGLSHLAAALGRPTIAIFGPTDPARWAPCGHHVTILRGQSCQCATWYEVQLCREKRCLAIPVQEIFRTIQAVRDGVHA